MSEKIIMLDFDGVLLPKKSYLTKHNKTLIKELNDALSNFDNDDRHKKFEFENNAIINLNFDEIVVQLINRACELTGAKVVILSNWRRRFKPELLKDKLIKTGLNEGHFHNNFYCHYKMNSSKSEEFHMWVYKNDPQEENEYVIIDDDYILSNYDKIGVQIQTNFDEGFTVDDYRVLIGLLGGVDKEYGIYQLSESEMSKVSVYFNSKRDMYNELYRLSHNIGYSAPKSTLLSFSAAVDANKDKSSSLFLGLPSYTDEQLYELRSKNVWQELELNYGKRDYNDLILVGSSDLSRFNIDIGDFEKHPKKYPCLIKNMEKIEYVYAPDNCRDEIDYLSGYADSMS